MQIQNVQKSISKKEYWTFLRGFTGRRQEIGIDQSGSHKGRIRFTEYRLSFEGNRYSLEDFKQRNYDKFMFYVGHMENGLEND